MESPLDRHGRLSKTARRLEIVGRLIPREIATERKPAPFCQSCSCMSKETAPLSPYLAFHPIQKFYANYDQKRDRFRELETIFCPKTEKHGYIWDIMVYITRSIWLLQDLLSIHR